MNAKMIFAVFALLSFFIPFDSQNKKAMNDTLQMQLVKSGEGRPLLLVPGGLTGWISWQPFEEIFATKQRSTLRVQLLNVQYGLENRELPEDYSVKTESRALKAALDASGDTMPMDVVAWSFGALTSLDYALDNPDRIRTLTLIEPPGFWVLRAMGPLNESESKTIEVMDGFHKEISEVMLETFLREAGFAQKGQSPRELPQWNNWLPYRQSLRNTRQVIAHEDKLQRLQSYNKPVLLVKGTGSSEWMHKVIDGLEKNLPNVRVIELPGGHAPHLVSKEKFLTGLEKFQSEN